MNRFVSIVSAVISIASITGCSGRPSLFPNPDPQLRKSSAEFAADSAKRFPYHADAPRSKMTSRAQVGYTANALEVVNLSGEDWHNVEIWVNRQYVVFVPYWKDHELKRLHFQMIFDDKGHYFPIDNLKTRVEQVEAFIDGKMYDIPTKLAD
jgi:hypothetical protein